MSNTSIWDFIKKESKKSSTSRLVRGSWWARSGCRLNLPQVRSHGDEQMRHFRTPRLTCTDSDSTNKLLSPAAAPHHQRQVRLLDQLVHRALQTKTKTSKEKGQVVGLSTGTRISI